MRDNETRKMELRIQAEASKLEKQNQKAAWERSQMEQNSRKRFSLFFVGDGIRTFFRLKDHSEISSFQVTLCKQVTISEIKERMAKAFGDL